jgi:hypothetical protein
MSTDLIFATGGFSQAIRFVLVNNRVPHTDQHCALRGGLIEKGYVRDSLTRLTDRPIGRKLLQHRCLRNAARCSLIADCAQHSLDKISRGTIQ